MKFVANSFSWPFRGDWKSRWLPGLVAVLLLPIAFIPLLGYAIAATRAAETDDAAGPPSWKLSFRLLSDGFWTAIVTGWALGLAAVGLLCVGLVPGVFYAILVSAHASAALHDKGANSPTR